MEKKNQTMRHYNQQAEIYNSQYLEEQNTKIKEILENLKINPKDLILDLGCGTGFLFPKIKEKAEITIGIDISKKALKLAKKYKKIIPNLVLVRADADKIPFIDQIFDKIFAITILQNVPESTVTITEMKRIGKSDAIFVITGFKKKFMQKEFINLLVSGGLRVILLLANPLIKDHVVICSNIKNMVEK